MEQIIKVLLTILGASILWVIGMQTLRRSQRPQSLAPDEPSRQKAFSFLSGGLVKTQSSMFQLRVVAFCMIFTLVLFCVTGILGAFFLQL
jgi:hypothetical protein